MSITPISDQLRAAILHYYKQKEKTENVLDVVLGKKPGGMVFITKAGKAYCIILEDKDFLYFSMPSKKEDRRIPKKPFLEKIGFHQ